MSSRHGSCIRQVAVPALLGIACLVQPLVWSPAGARLAAAELTDQQVLDVLTVEAPRDVAIRKGLEFLRTQQRPDGTLTANVPVALTSLAVMAHLAAGETPEDAAVGPFLHKAIDAVLALQDQDGYFGSRDGSRMYGHGIATLMLAEVAGMSREPEFEERVRAALVRAVAVTVGAAQVPKDDNSKGGWHYTPDAHDADLSLAGWQIMSLHAATQCGISVPDGVITGAVDYARHLTTADGKVGYNTPGDDHPPLRGLALMCFAIGHHEDDPNCAHVAARIRSDPIQWQGGWMFYRAYYDAVGMSRSAPGEWEAYGPVLEQVLVSHQNPDGSWPSPPGDDEGGQGAVYMTSMAILALAVNRHVLPAYQR
jgi:hypothetical protein